MGITNFQTTIGLLNGMIGGTILVLPLLGIVVGYVSVIAITAFLATVSGYTAYLIVKHLGKATSINQAIRDHFDGNHNYSIFYNIFISITFWSSIFGYFHLLMLQIIGLFDFNSKILPLVIFILLFFITLTLKVYQFTEKLLAYGIISIFGYIIFLIWAQMTAPVGPRYVEPFGRNYPNYSAVLLGALSIHDFLVQVMIHNPRRKQFPKLILWTYILGATAYIFMGLGCFAIINRQSRSKEPQLITDYFAADKWQIHVIQLLYMIHLLSALPEYVLISKIRFMQALGYEEKNGLEWKQIGYIFVILLLAHLIYTQEVDIRLLLQIGGSLIGFIYIIIIPVVIHLKCVYYDKASGQIVNEPQQNKLIKKNNCQCNIRYSSRITQLMEIGWIFITISIAGSITIFTLYSIIVQRTE